jgi:hypothetical protein
MSESLRRASSQGQREHVARIHRLVAESGPVGTPGGDRQVEFSGGPSGTREGRDGAPADRHAQHADGMICPVDVRGVHCEPGERTTP